jgi:salicylate hydroxylase
MTSLLIGADGINSKVRNYVVNPSPKTTAATTTETTANQQQQQQSLEEFMPNYTGVTCLMGCANVPRIRGICFPSSATTKCHACYYPTKVPKEEDIIDTNNEEKRTENNKYADNNNYEQVFQIYFPSPIERPDTWRTLTPDEAKTECKELAKKLREDGWDEQFLAPLESSTLTGVLRVGLRSREALDVWHVGDAAADNNNDEEVGSSTSVGRAVLLGDSAHPPVPYIGQGAMMAMEDAGTLSLLLAHFCPINGDSESTIDLSKFQTAMKVYENLRVPRTKAVLGSSVQLGKTQQKRADSKLYNAWREVSIKAQVWAYGTLPVMKPGAAFDYRAKVAEALEELHTV